MHVVAQANDMQTVGDGEIQVIVPTGMRAGWINAETEEPGDEVILRKRVSLEDEQEAVRGFDWFAYRPPSMKAFRQAYKDE